MSLKVSKVGISWITTELIRIDANERYWCRCGLHWFLYKGKWFSLLLLILISCSKEQPVYPTIDPMKITIRSTGSVLIIGDPNIRINPLINDHTQYVFENDFTPGSTLKIIPENSDSINVQVVYEYYYYFNYFTYKGTSKELDIKLP